MPSDTSKCEGRRPRTAWVLAYDFTGTGGIQRFSKEVVLAMPEYDVVQIAFGNANYVSSLRGQMCRAWGLFREFVRTVFRGVHRRPAVIVCTHPHLGPLASIVSRMFRCPYVVTAHGIDICQSMHHRRKRALREADRVWAVSEYTCRLLVTHVGIDERAIDVIGNTVDERRFTIRPSDEAVRSSVGIRKNERVLLTVCRMSRSEAYKGYDRVIAALPQILQSEPTVHYVIVGRGDDAARIEKLIDATGLRTRVTVAQHISDDVLPLVYNLADVFVMPSTGEGFGIVYLEALASGVPVVAGHSDGAVDAVKNGHLGMLVDPLNPSRIAEAVVAHLRRSGTSWWYVPSALRAEALAAFGREPFRQRVASSLFTLLRKPAQPTA